MEESLQIPNVELANVSVGNHFGDGEFSVDWNYREWGYISRYHLRVSDSAVSIYVPCNTADSTSVSDNIERNADIDITNGGDFPMTNSDQVFTAAVDASVNHTDNGFSVDETTLFNESRVSVVSIR